MGEEERRLFSLNKGRGKGKGERDTMWGVGGGNSCAHKECKRGRQANTKGKRRRGKLSTGSLGGGVAVCRAFLLPFGEGREIREEEIQRLKVTSHWKFEKIKEPGGGRDLCTLCTLHPHAAPRQK